jgi:chromosome segregation ATPase
MRPTTVALALALLVAVPALGGCKSVYNNAREWMGTEKREILRDELTGMVGDQQEAEMSFASALDRVKALTAFEGGSLEQEYNKLKDAYDDAQSDAKAISSRIADVDDIGHEMFLEWGAEIEQMRTPSLKESSRRKLRDTRERFDRMLTTLRSSRDSMDDVLAVFNDHVLFLKHNLNAAAIGSLGDELDGIEDDIAALRKSIERSIEEAQAFITDMPQ